MFLVLFRGDRKRECAKLAKPNQTNKPHTAQSAKANGRAMSGTTTPKHKFKKQHDFTLFLLAFQVAQKQQNDLACKAQPNNQTTGRPISKTKRASYEKHCTTKWRFQKNDSTWPGTWSRLGGENARAARPRRFRPRCVRLGLWSTRGLRAPEGEPEL